MKTTVRLLALALGVGLSNHAVAGGFTPWGTATGDRTVALTPYFFMSASGEATISPYVWFGATDHFDVMVGYSATLDAAPGEDGRAFTSGAIELMPRGIINDYAIFGLHALYTPGDSAVVLGPEFHGVAASQHFMFTYNTGWWASLGGADGFDPGTWFAVLAPEFLVSDRFSVFAEFNPSIGLTDGAFSANVVPGLTFYVDKDMKHSLTTAATMNVAPSWGGVTFGLLYCTSIDMKRRRPEASPVAQSRRASMAAASLQAR